MSQSAAPLDHVERPTRESGGAPDHPPTRWATLLDSAGLLALGLRGFHAAVVAGDPLEADDLLPLVNLASELRNTLDTLVKRAAESTR